jgi:hypothetical protein
MPRSLPPYPRGVDADRDWATLRNRAIAAHAADLARREAAEAAQAAELLRGFVAAARERGLAPVPLTARDYGGPPARATGLVKIRPPPRSRPEGPPGKFGPRTANGRS